MNMDAEVVAKLVQFAQFTLGVVWERVMLLLGIVLCAAAFGYALWRGEAIVSITACAFALLVFWPLVKLESKRNTP